MLEFDPQHHAGLQLNLNVILGHFLDGGRHRRLAQHNPDALIHFQGCGIHFDQRCFDSDGSSLGSGFRLVGFGGSIGLAHGAPLNEHDLLLLMGEMEGKISGSVHYDNVAPCYLGGMQLVLEEHGVISQGIPVFEQWYWVVCYPGTVVSTAAARAILPAQYRRQDCLTYGRRLAAFVHASYTGQEGLAASVLKDVIAEPYRSALIEGFAEVRAQAAQNGALATGISGSGPSVFVVMKDLAQAERMKDWMDAHFVQNEDGFARVCKLDMAGARVTGSEL